MLPKWLSFLVLSAVVSLLFSSCSPAVQVTNLSTNAPNVPIPTSTTLPSVVPMKATSTPTAAATAVALTEKGLISYSDAVPLYQYDQAAPFDLQVSSEMVQDGITIRDVSYAAANPSYAEDSNGRISAYIVVPPGKGPFAGTLFMHGLGSGWGNRKEFLDEAISLAHQDVISVLPAGLFPWKVDFNGTAKGDQLNVINQVIELRRSIDLLLMQPGVDPERTAFVGHDYGAMHGALIAGIDKRLKSYILMAGDSDYSHWAIAYFVYPDDVDTYKKLMAAVDPVSYLPHASPASIYFQFGKTDNFVSMESANQQYEAASQPKKIDWYDGGHTLNDQAVKDRLAWLEIQLNLKPEQK